VFETYLPFARGDNNGDEDEGHKRYEFYLITRTGAVHTIYL
jgi:hypothetical protein